MDKLKTVKTVEELGENGKTAAKSLIHSGKQYSMSFDKLGLALVGFLAACQTDKVVLKQNVVSGMARCSTSYISRISKAVVACANKNSGDFSKAEIEARETGIAHFLQAYNPTAPQRGERSNKAPTNKDAKTATASAGLGLDDLQAMAKNLHEQIQRNMPKLDKAGKQAIANQLMDTWDMLNQSELPKVRQDERTVSTAVAN